MVGIWLEFGRGWKLAKTLKHSKVLGIGLPTVENLSGPQESIFILFRGPQLNSRKTKSKRKRIIFTYFSDFPVFSLLAHVGPMAVWGLGLLFWPERKSKELGQDKCGDVLEDNRHVETLPPWCLRLSLHVENIGSGKC